jgi:branched-chain amino acid transport system substrate-binding protein
LPLRRPALAAGCLIALLALTTAGCGSTPPAGSVRGRTLTVYTSLPLRGANAAQAASVLDAERLALKQAGDRAGRYRLRLLPLDDSNPQTGRWDPGLVSVNARQATQDKTTIAYLGELDPGASAISIPILNSAGILEVSPTDSYVGLTQPAGAERDEPLKYYPTDRRTFVRTVPPDNLEAIAQAAAMRRAGIQRLYLVQDGGFYGQAMTRNVASAARSQGIQVVGELVSRPQPGDDQTPVALSIARMRPDAVFFAGLPSLGVDNLWKAVVHAQPGVKLFGPSILAVPTFLAALGPVEDQAYITTPTLDPRMYPAAGQRFFDAYRREYGVAPESQAIFGYAAMQLVINSIASAGRRGNRRSTVIGQAFGAYEPDSALGPFSISKDGDPTLAAIAINRVHGGVLAFQRAILAQASIA